MLTDIKFSTSAIISYAESKVGKGSYELEQIELMHNSLRRMLSSMQDEIEK